MNCSARGANGARRSICAGAALHLSPAITAAASARSILLEVKLRKSDAFGEAREFVDARKQERIRATAALWLETHETALQPRFDVVEVYAPDGMHTKAPEIRLIEDAF